MASVREFLDEIDELFGFYFDVGLACWFARVRIEQLQQEICANDDSPLMYSDGPPEDSPEREIEKSLHATIISSVKKRLEKDGFNTIRAAEAAIVFVYHIWDEKYRNNLTDADGQRIDRFNSDIMGDLRLLRNPIIHNKGVAQNDIVKCKIIKKFAPGDRIILTNQDIHEIIRAIRAEFYPLI
jgi:hypothetical protein